MALRSDDLGKNGIGFGISGELQYPEDPEQPDSSHEHKVRKRHRQVEGQNCHEVYQCKRRQNVSDSAHNRAI